MGGNNGNVVADELFCVDMTGVAALDGAAA